MLEVWAGCCGTRAGDWGCEAERPSCGTFAVRTPGAGSASDGLVYAAPLFQRIQRSCRSPVVPRRPSLIWGRDMAQEVRLERPACTSCRVGPDDGCLGNAILDRQEVHVYLGHGEIGGTGRLCVSCSSERLPVRRRSTSQSCRVRKSRDEAEKHYRLLSIASGWPTKCV